METTSESDSESDFSDLSDDEDEDKLADLQLMGEVTACIQSFTSKPAGKVASHAVTSWNLDELSRPQLISLLSLITEAMEHNCFLQHLILLKEAKLVAVRRQLQGTSSRPVREPVPLDSQRDIGRYIVQFKSPYFKTTRNFASYVVVPEERLPMSAHRFHRFQFSEWNQVDLKHLQRKVESFTTLHAIRSLQGNTFRKSLSKREMLHDSSSSYRSMATTDIAKVVDWCRIASELTKDFTPSECEKAWLIYLRPGLNRKRWSAAEQVKLKQLALEHNYENWDVVADKLGSGRSGFQCFLVYAEAIMKQSEGEWSKAEEDSLIDMVKSCTYGKRILWRKIAYYFESRSLGQIYRKWNLSSVGKDIQAGPFTEQEDQLIINSLILNQGRLPAVANQLNRIPSQIHYRLSQLKSSMVHCLGEWTLAEDKQLLELVERFGTRKWAVIAEHLKSRGRVQIRHRYVHLANRQAADPGFSIESMQRSKRSAHRERQLSNRMYLLGQVKREAQLSETLGQLVLNFKDEPECQPKKKKKIKHKRDPELCSDIVKFYSGQGDYVGHPRRSLPGDTAHRTGFELELLNALLRFAPDRHADPRTADWPLTADKSDPHFDEVFNLSTSRSDPVNEELMRSRKRSSRSEHCLPPNVSTFEAFANLLVDVGKLDEPHVEDSLRELYSVDDEEMQVAVAKWKRRLRQLFTWPAALGNINLQEEPSAAGTHSDESTNE